MSDRILELAAVAIIATFANISGASAADDIKQFHSPTKNIYCVGVNSPGNGGRVDCELVTRTNAEPLMNKPMDCELDWGNRFSLRSDGRASMECSGDTLRDPNAFVLGYGAGLDRYGIHCTSTEQGIECINDDQHGFKISKGKQEIY